MSSEILITLPLIPLLFSIYSLVKIYRIGVMVRHPDLRPVEHFVIVFGLWVFVVVAAVSSVAYYYLLFTKIFTS